jgi:transposase-like protein
VGEITFAVPQVRESGFYPEALEKGLRSERAQTLSLAEMYVQGVSTRKVKAITEQQLCGKAVPSSQVSNAAALLDTELEKWRNRPLGEYPYLFLDAYYEQVRERIWTGPPSGCFGGRGRESGRKTRDPGRCGLPE